MCVLFFFFSSRRRHTRSLRDWSSDVCSSDLERIPGRRARRSATARPPDGASKICVPFGPGYVPRRTHAGAPEDGAAEGVAEIGRASCRERVESSGGAVQTQKKTIQLRCEMTE